MFDSPEDLFRNITERLKIQYTFSSRMDLYREVDETNIKTLDRLLEELKMHRNSLRIEKELIHANKLLTEKIIMLEKEINRMKKALKQFEAPFG